MPALLHYRLQNLDSTNAWVKNLYVYSSWKHGCKWLLKLSSHLQPLSKEFRDEMQVELSEPRLVASLSRYLKISDAKPWAQASTQALPLYPTLVARNFKTCEIQIWNDGYKNQFWNLPNFVLVIDFFEISWRFKNQILCVLKKKNNLRLRITARTYELHCNNKSANKLEF